MQQSDKFKKYTNLRIKIVEEYYDLAYGLIFLYNPIGIEERFDELIITFLSEDFNDDFTVELLNDLKNIYPKTELIATEFIEEINWNREWEESIQPIDIDNKIFISPQWILPPINDYRIHITINPKMSFGTGHHSTTRLVSRLLLDTVKKGSKWLDAGCGTGILSIIAIKLGAGSVLAVDNNDWAIENAEENLRLNSIESGIELFNQGIEDFEIPDVDGIMANLYTHLLLSNFEKFFNALKKKNGVLLASGVLNFDEEIILKKAVEVGFKHLKTLYEEEWCAFHFSTG